jgi:hypothetical protein
VKAVVVEKLFLNLSLFWFDFYVPVICNSTDSSVASHSYTFRNFIHLCHLKPHQGFGASTPLPSFVLLVVQTLL